jgi:hypothetical protein
MGMRELAHGEDGVYSIELPFYAQNSEKLRVYVPIAKNYHNSFPLFQIALIAN